MSSNISQVLITGSTGLIGSALVKPLEQSGYSVKKLVRSAADPKLNKFNWDPETGNIDPTVLTNAQALIHLAGENIAEGRWTQERKQKLRDSRIKVTQNLCNTLLKSNAPLKVAIMASAIGYYGNRGSEILTEESSPGTGFLADLTKEWEEANKIISDNGIRLINLRIGIVLSPNGGALSKMMLPFQLGLGGQLGDGKHYMSWVALDDVVNIILFLLKNPEISGNINVTAPTPVTNAEFTKAFAKVLYRPSFFTVPAFAARIAFGELADEALFSSCKAIPARLQASGYKFLYPNLLPALEHLLKK